MNIPASCPICNALLQDYKDDILADHETVKRCFDEKHHISFLIINKELNQVSISFDIEAGQDAVWFNLNTALPIFAIVKTNAQGVGRFSHQLLPYFEPDLSDYPKLINKIKIYLLFS